MNKINIVTLPGFCCHGGAFANAYFMLCRGQRDGHRVRRKVESSSSEAKIVSNWTGKEKYFSKPTGKGDYPSLR